MRDLLEVFKKLIDCIPEDYKALKESFQAEYIYLESCLPFKAPEIHSDLWRHATDFLNQKMNSSEMLRFSDAEWTIKMQKIWADKE
jgi:hypothetical protein